MYRIPEPDLIVKQVRAYRFVGTQVRGGKVLGIRQVAKEMGISTATLSRFENTGKTSLESYMKIVNWLDRQNKMPATALSQPTRQEKK